MQFSVTKWNEMKWEFTNVLSKIAINRNSRMQNFGSAGVDDYVCTINGLPLQYHYDVVVEKNPRISHACGNNRLIAEQLKYTFNCCSSYLIAKSVKY